MELVEAGEPNVRLKVEIDRMNNAMKDCYQEENVTRLKFASQNTLGGLKHVREMMFPKYYDYPKTDCFAEEAKQYIDSLRALREFGEGKERVSFRFGDIHPKVGCFEDESPRPKGRGFWANLFVN